MVQKFKLIYNPAARGGKSKKFVPVVTKLLDEEGIDYTLAETQRPLHAIELAANAKKEGYSLVCSIGGDGTAHEVANGAIQSKTTFGIIPAGSGNDFSKGIGLNGDIKQAVDTLIRGNTHEISTIKVGDRYSINVVDAGLGGEVAKRSIESLKWMKGSMKYTLLMVRSLLTHKPYPTILKLDDEEFHFDVNLLAAGFGQSFGSGMLILPDARYKDPEMSIAVIKDASKFTILRVFPKVFSGKHVNYDKYVTMLKGKKLEIIPNETRKMLSEAEGELIGQAPLTFEAKEKNFLVKVPEKWDLENPSLWKK